MAADSTSWFTDYTAVGQPQQAELARVSTRLPSILIAELAAAQIDTSASASEILIAALGRALARTLGSGQLLVDVHADGVFRHGLSMQCVAEREVTAADLLAAVQPRDDAPPNAAGAAELLFSYRGAVTADEPEGSYLLTLHVRPGSDGTDLLQLDWWYDTRSFDVCTIEELADQFPLALIELTSG